jgi:aminoglycoside phosphotransferase (APT) family kinase protein
MPPARMHTDEVDIDAALVARLLTGQYPEWTGLALSPVQSAGTDHALYRLGADMLVRLPRIPSAVSKVAKEGEWLPRLAPALPLAVPQPLALGAPCEGFPWPWSVYRWLEGETVWENEPLDAEDTGRRLGRFVAALARIDPAGGPPPGEHNSFRGEPLAGRDGEVRRAVAALAGEVEADVVTAVWEAALNAPLWAGPACWLHGDLLPTNLLVRDGRLSAVIDFGCLGVGDPACDLMAAWASLPAGGRERFRTLTGADDAAWARGRGWALSQALIAIPYYRETNPVLAGIGRRTIAEIVADAGA